MLVQLPNGNWIDPRGLRYAGTLGEKQGYQPTLYLVYKDGRELEVGCASGEQVAELRDRLAALANQKGAAALTEYLTEGSETVKIDDFGGGSVPPASALPPLGSPWPEEPAADSEIARRVQDRLGRKMAEVLESRLREGSALDAAWKAMHRAGEVLEAKSAESAEQEADLTPPANPFYEKLQ